MQSRNTRLKDEFTIEERKLYKPKIVARNTFKYHKDEIEVIRLHSTDIVTKYPDGSIKLDSGGWRTMTTKDRMNTELESINCFITQTRGAWTIHQRDGGSVVYYDGIVIPDCFTNEKSQKLGEAKLKKDNHLRKGINKLVAKIKEDNSLPSPSNGDCWYCLMRTQDNEPLGDSTNNSDHLLQHVKEGYLHGSLILNALLWAGYTNPGFVINHGSRSLVRSALRRYLKSKLGIA